MICLLPAALSFRFLAGFAAGAALRFSAFLAAAHRFRCAAAIRRRAAALNVRFGAGCAPSELTAAALAP